MRLLKINMIVTVLLAMFLTVSCTKNKQYTNEVDNSSASANYHNSHAANLFSPIKKPDHPGDYNGPPPGKTSKDRQDSLFKSWDSNSNDVITKAEFNKRLNNSGIFKEWDANGNGTISNSEWNNGINTTFGHYDKGDYGKFNSWDKNGDGVIEKGEFDNAIFNFVDHNSNGKISKREFENWFDWWKADIKNNS